MRNTAFDAKVWTQAAGTPVGDFHLNQFGGTIGFPIMKNHLFFFGDVQNARYVNGANPSTLSVPTARMRRGDFTELLNPLLSGNSCPIVLYVPNTNTGTYTCTSGAIPSGKGPTGTLQQYGTLADTTYRRIYVCSRPERLLANPTRSGCPESASALSLPELR